jgi:hypothetical protein
MLKNEKGHTMVAILTVMVVLSIMMVGFCFSVTNTLKRSGVQKNTTSALNIAEAGEEAAIAQFRSKAITPVAGRTATLFDNTAFAGGTYTVQYAVDAAADTVRITSNGVFGSARRAIQTTYIAAGCVAPTDAAYDYGIVAGGAIGWSGSGTCNTGSANIWCGGQFSMSGSSDFICQALSSSVKISMSGSGNINGNVKAPQFSHSGSGTITGTQTTGSVASISIPVIDLTPYYNMALSNNQVYSNKSISGSTTTTVPGGVMWVNGTFTCSGSGDFNGTIIATGNVSISGSGDFTAASTYPAIVSRDGNISMSGSGSVTGLIYAGTGQISKSGSGDVVGSLICGGDFSKSGSWNTLSYQKSAPLAPGCSGATYQELSWRELQQ